MPPPRDLTQLLTSVSLPEETKAQLWDVFQQAQTPDELAARLQPLPVPEDIKADLWDLKSAAPAPAASAPQMTFATVNGQRVPIDTWAEKLDVDRTMVAPAVDFAEGLAAVPGQLVFGGGDVIRRALDMPRVVDNPGVQRAMSVPDSSAGQAGNMVGQLAPLAYGLVTAPVVTTAGVLASLFAKPAQPIIESAAGAAGAKPQQAEALGTIGEFLLGSGLGIGASKGAERYVSPRVAGWLRNPDPVDAAAVDSALQQGLPVDVPTATGNRALRGAQWLADRTLPGSAIATRRDRSTIAAWRDRWDALTRQTGVSQPTSLYEAGTQAQAGVQASQEAVGRGWRRSAEKVEGRLSNGQPLSPEAAGVGVKGRLTDVVTRLRDTASRGYRSAWGLVNRNPVSVPSIGPNGETMAVQMAAPVDMRSIKAAAAPQLRLMDQWLDPARRNASAGYQALKSIVNGPDYMPAEIAEMGRSGLLELAREADMPAARDVNQATGARLAAMLTDQINIAMNKHGGPEALAALQAARATHAEKMGVVEVLKTLADEPVQAFGNLTWTQDKGIARLRAIDQAAPDALPEIGRAWFRQLIDQFTSNGALDLTKASTMQRMWAELGPQTKELFFKDRAQRQALDAFFAQLSQGRTALGPNLGSEPAQVARVLIGRNETHAKDLQAIARLAPNVPRLLGRAALDEVAAKFDENPSIENLSKFRTWWNSQGRIARALLYPDPSLAQQIDQATRVMQLISENPNRSGTAFVGALAAQGAALIEAPVTAVGLQTLGGIISAAMRSPRTARMLAQGLQLPNTSQAAQLAGVLIQAILVEQQGVPPTQAPQAQEAR